MHDNMNSVPIYGCEEDELPDMSYNEMKQIWSEYDNCGVKLFYYVSIDDKKYFLKR